MAAQTTKPKTAAQRLLAEVLHVVRGPFFLFGVSAILMVAIPACQATLLKGYLSASQEATAPKDDPSQALSAAAHDSVPGLVESEMPQVAPDAAMARTTNIGTPAEALMRQRARSLQALVEKNSFPVSFAGTWKVVTMVVDSGVVDVPVGQRLESQVWFVPLSSGRIVARWSQPGWTEAQENIMPLSDREAEMERTNYFVEDGQNGWAAHSHDHYLKLDDQRMTASSEVEQYVEGQYLGKYETKSMLYRLNTRVAMQ